MVHRQIGEELSQSARSLFDEAARKWYLSILIEVGAGVLAAILGLLDLTGDWALLGAVAGTLLLIVAYVLRLQYDAEYDIAETMRRQSVFTEALDWPVDRVQLSEWRNRVGRKIREQLRNNPRPPDYYTSEKGIGPERLAEMTIESAFYTRHLYMKLRSWIWTFFIGACFVVVLVVSIALTRAIPDRVDLLIARVLYALIPVVLATNLLGWGLKMNRLVSGIREVEEDLEQLCGAGNADVQQVMRLVAEYNCQVVSGFPIHNKLFQRWHGEIYELWSMR